MIQRRRPIMQLVLDDRRIGLALVLGGLLLLMASCYSSPLEEARQQVPSGTLRDAAINILSERAWYHQACPNRVTVDDLFFFGSHKYDKAEVVIVNSEPVNGVFVVYQVGSFDEANAWHAAYRDCLQRERFED